MATVSSLGCLRSGMGSFIVRAGSRLEITAVIFSAAFSELAFTFSTDLDLVFSWAVFCFSSFCARLAFLGALRSALSRELVTDEMAGSREAATTCKSAAGSDEQGVKAGKSSIERSNGGVGDVTVGTNPWWNGSKANVSVNTTPTKRGGRIF